MTWSSALGHADEYKRQVPPRLGHFAFVLDTVCVLDTLCGVLDTPDSVPNTLHTVSNTLHRESNTEGDLVERHVDIGALGRLVQLVVAQVLRARVAARGGNTLISHNVCIHWF